MPFTQRRDLKANAQTKRDKAQRLEPHTSKEMETKKENGKPRLTNDSSIIELLIQGKECGLASRLVS